MMFPNYPAFILAAPLAAGLIIGLLGSTNGQKVVRLGVAAEVIAFVLALFLLFDVTVRGTETFSPVGLERRFFTVWLVCRSAVGGDADPYCRDQHSDPAFSIRYMHQERGYARFHSLLAFTTFVYSAWYRAAIC